MANQEMRYSTGTSNVALPSDTLRCNMAYF